MLSRELVRQGHSVSFVSSLLSPRKFRRENYPSGVQDYHGVSAYRLPFLFEIGDWAYFDSRYYRRIIELCPDVINSHEARYQSSYICARIREKRRIPFVITQHAYRPVHNPVAKPFYLSWMRRFGVYTLKRVDLIIALSEAQKGYLKQWHVPDEKIRIVPSGVDTARFRPVNPREKNRRDNKQLRVAFVGEYCNRKLALLLPVVRELCSRHLSCRFSFIGTGPLACEIARLSKTFPGQVVDKGFMPSEQLAGELAHSDLFVAPSLEEPFGLAALEAQASGLPAVVTNVGGLSGVVEHNKTGLVVAPREEAVRDALLILIQDSGLRRRMSRLARSRAVKLFSWQSIAKQTLAVYREAIGLCSNT